MILRLIVSLIFATCLQSANAAGKFVVITISGQHIVAYDNGALTFSGPIVVDSKCSDISGEMTIMGVTFNEPSSSAKYFVDGEVVDVVEDWMDYRIIDSESTTPVKVNTSMDGNSIINDTCVQISNINSFVAALLGWDVDAVQSTIDEQVYMEIPISTPITTHVVNWHR